MRSSPVASSFTQSLSDSTFFFMMAPSQHVHHSSFEVHDFDTQARAFSPFPSFARSH